MRALSDQTSLEHITSLICLGTPFLRVKMHPPTLLKAMALFLPPLLLPILYLWALKFVQLALG